MAYQMLAHSIRMLWANLGNAARVSIIPLIAMYASFAVIGVLIFATGGGGEPSVAMIILGGLLAFAAVFFFTAWMAVNWHRFILLEEYPQGWFPKWHADQIKGYAGKMVLLMLFFLVIMIPFGLVFGILFGGLGVVSEGAAAVVLVIAILAFIPLVLWLTFRLSAMLPGAAVSNSLGLMQAWTATSSHSGLIFRFAMLYFLFVLVVQVVLAIVQLIPIIGFLLTIPVSWFLYVLGFSVMTTVYGVAIERRELT